MSNSLLVKDERLYLLRRLKDLGALDETLMNLLDSLRSVLEISVPLWTGALTRLYDLIWKQPKYLTMIAKSTGGIPGHLKNLPGRKCVSATEVFNFRRLSI